MPGGIALTRAHPTVPRTAEPAQGRRSSHGLEPRPAYRAAAARHAGGAATGMRGARAGRGRGCAGSAEPAEPSRLRQADGRQAGQSKLNRYDGLQNYALYRFQFMSHAENCGWTLPDIARELTNALIGKALEALNNLPQGAVTFSALDSALMRRFGKNRKQ